MIKNIWDFMNSAVIIAIIPFICKQLNRIRKKLENFIALYEIKNDLAVYILVQTELISLILAWLTGGLLISIFQTVYECSFIIVYLFTSILSMLINVIIVLICMNIFKETRILSKKNIIIVVLNNIIFACCFVCYIEESFSEYRIYAKIIFSLFITIFLLIQFFTNCKKVKIKKIEYNIDTLDYEHYITYDKLIYKDQFLIIKLKKGKSIQLPIARIKKITSVICDVE